MSATDITNRTNAAAIVLLCAFNEAVCTPAGRVEPDQEGFALVVDGQKPRHFQTASGAVEVLRRVSKQPSR
jgi:hypothetical protein